MILTGAQGVSGAQEWFHHFLWPAQCSTDSLAVIGCWMHRSCNTNNYQCFRQALFPTQEVDWPSSRWWNSSPSPIISNKRFYKQYLADISRLTSVPAKEMLAVKPSWTCRWKPVPFLLPLYATLFIPLSRSNLKINSISFNFKRENHPISAGTLKDMIILTVLRCWLTPYMQGVTQPSSHIKHKKRNKDGETDPFSDMTALEWKFCINLSWRKTSVLVMVT